MVLLQTSGLSIAQRITLIKTAGQVNVSDFGMYNLLDRCDDLARTFFKTDLVSGITARGSVMADTSLSPDKQVFPLWTINPKTNGILSLIQWSNKTALILILIGLNDDDDDTIIDFQNEQKENLLRSYNSTLDIQKETAVAFAKSQGQGTFG